MVKPDWQTADGSIRLYRGDCLEIMPQLTDTVDCICTDLPYGTLSCAWDVVIPFEPLWASYKRVIKPKGAIVLFGSQPFTSALVMSNVKWFRHEWAWDKKRATGGVNAKHAPMKAHENIVVFGKNAPTYNPQMTTWDDRKLKLMRRHDFTRKADEAHSHREHISPGRESCAARGMYPVSVIRFPALGSIDSERTGHPTQKPVALLEYLIKTYTNENETVLDNTFGSASCAVACLNTGRKFIGIERDPAYFDLAVTRLETALGNVGLFADTAPLERSLSHA